MNVGFIGLGTMGLPMAHHLQAGGHQLHLSKHRTPLPYSLLDGGAISHASAKEVAENAEILIVMVPNTPDVEQALFGPNGVIEGLATGKAIVDMSSIDPLATREFAGRIEALGCDYIDAPVSGGEIGAQDASLTIMCGGNEDAFARVRPLLELMGTNITLVGDTGSGQITKMANQIIVALNIEAVAEALVLASKAGADVMRVRQALMGGFAASRVLEVHGERMINRTFEPGFRIELHQKDLALALDCAGKLGVSLPNTATAQQLFNACSAHGMSQLDHSAMVKSLELLAS